MSVNSLKSIFCFFACIHFLWSCKPAPEETQPIREPILESVYASGVIKSAGQYQVFSRVNGVVESVLVKDGDLVSKGQALIKISAEAAKITEANAQLSADYASVGANQEKIMEWQHQVDLAYAKVLNDSLLLERQKSLWDKQIGSRIELEKRELAYKNSITNWNAAKLRLADVKKQLVFNERQSNKNLMGSKISLSDYVIKSEQAGRVYKLMKEKGEMVTIQTPVAIIGDAADFVMEMEIDEYDISKVTVGQKVLVRMDSYKDQTFEAAITRIIPIMNEQSRSFTAEAAFDEKPPVLYPNLTLEANIIINKQEDALTIPRHFLLTDSTVMVKEEGVRKIKTGLKDFRKVEVLEGLKEGEWLIKPKQ